MGLEGGKEEMEILKQQLEKGTFYYHKFGLLIESEINLVLQVDEGKLTVCFNGGIVDVYRDCIQEVSSPSESLNKFEWCYKLKNYYDETIGYIGEIKK